MLKDKDKIIDWLKIVNILDYELIPNEKYGYVVNVNESVNLNNKSLIFLSVKFGEIKGDFDCSKNNLKSLIGFPDVVNGYFSASYNEIEDLDYFPKFVKYGIDLNHNKIKEIKNLPKKVDGNLNLNSNQIKIIENVPEEVYQSFNFRNNPLEKINKFPIGKILILDNQIIELLDNELIDYIFNSPLDNVEINGKQNPILAIKFLEAKKKKNDIENKIVIKQTPKNKI